MALGLHTETAQAGFMASIYWRHRQKYCTTTDPQTGRAPAIRRSAFTERATCAKRA
jgi:hypothetical protein